MLSGYVVSFILWKFIAFSASLFNVFELRALDVIAMTR